MCNYHHDLYGNHIKYDNSEIKIVDDEYCHKCKLHKKQIIYEYALLNEIPSKETDESYNPWKDTKISENKEERYHNIVQRSEIKSELELYSHLNDKTRLSLKKYIDHEYDLDQIDERVQIALQINDIDNSDRPNEEKKMIKGLINLIYCPKFKEQLNSILNKDLTDFDRLKIILQAANTFDIHKTVIENILDLPWKSKFPKAKKGQCGGCYDNLYHTCTGIDCIFCNGTGYRKVSCKHCSKLKHDCIICSNGYIKDSEGFRKTCPIIKKMKDCKKCKFCKGKPDEIHKKCKGSCPYLQYTTLIKIDHNEFNLGVGCACGRPHRIGDCPKLIDTSSNKLIDSPYQSKGKCSICQQYHPQIISFEYIPGYRPEEKKNKRRNNVNTKKFRS